MPADGLRSRVGPGCFAPLFILVITKCRLLSSESRIFICVRISSLQTLKITWAPALRYCFAACLSTVDLRPLPIGLLYQFDKEVSQPGSGKENSKNNVWQCVLGCVHIPISLSLKFMAVTTVNRNEQEADLLPHTQGLKMNLTCDEESLTYTQGLPI